MQLSSHITSLSVDWSYTLASFAPCFSTHKDRDEHGASFGSWLLALLLTRIGMNM